MTGGRPFGRSSTASGNMDLAASIMTGADEDLDRAVDEALAGLSASDMSGESRPMPSSDEPAPDTLVTGRVANIGSEDVLIDFGGKLLGCMPKVEFGPEEHYAVGDRIEVLVVGPDPRGGLLSVSRKRAKQAAILQRMQIGMVVEGHVTGMNKGGLEMDIEGLRGFIPASQVENHFVKDISNLIGQKIRAEVTKFDLADKNIVLSRRKILMREEEERREAAFNSLQIGEVRTGKVRSLAEYGAFVDIGGVDGLLHVSDMSWGRVNKPEDIVKVGDEVQVKITKISREKKKISLSLKQARPNPWSTVGERYQVNSKLQGRVVRLAEFGAFVELEPGVDGLIPIGEMSWTKRIRHPSEVVKEGDMVEVQILSIDQEKQRISLGLKQLKEDPWTVAAEKFAVGSTINGKVVRTTDFGAFVQIEDGIDGLIHISEMSDTRIRAVTDKVKVGQDVEVRVLGVDPVNKKVSLSLRKPPPEPTPEEIAAIEKARIAAEKKREKSKARRGGITVDWQAGLESLDPSRFAS